MLLLGARVAGALRWRPLSCQPERCRAGRMCTRRQGSAPHTCHTLSGAVLGYLVPGYGGVAYRGPSRAGGGGSQHSPPRVLQAPAGSGAEV